jgi:hypothetical protein
MPGSGSRSLRPARTETGTQPGRLAQFLPGRWRVVGDGEVRTVVPGIPGILVDCSILADGGIRPGRPLAVRNVPGRDGEAPQRAGRRRLPLGREPAASVIEVWTARRSARARCRRMKPLRSSRSHIRP